MIAISKMNEDDAYEMVLGVAAGKIDLPELIKIMKKVVK
jgi:hypothetical protein